MRWKISHQNHRHGGHDPRQIDLVAIAALLIVIVAAFRFYSGDPNHPAPPLSSSRARRFAGSELASKHQRQKKNPLGLRPLGGRGFARGGLGSTDGADEATSAAPGPSDGNLTDSSRLDSYDRQR